ncbi:MULTISPECIES: hypothetical protein [unclassified Microcoleus]|uniref:hypothetical protein n=1 Tax=unclassified Microcoleus TaxID=2642155 RepID=UPI0025D8868B|nr:MULTISPECIES: hypothetical protein [unclassified Microcoleus]
MVIDSGQWAVGSGQWAVGSGQWAVDASVARNPVSASFAFCDEKSPKKPGFTLGASAIAQYNFQLLAVSFLWCCARSHAV